MEVVRVLGQKLSDGWRPRRSLVFLSWGAEEFGLQGSVEFSEEFAKKLSDRAVSYLNVDICMSGDVLFSDATPTIQHKVCTINVRDEVCVSLVLQQELCFSLT